METDGAAQSPFDTWREVAQPKAQLWRTAIGIVMAVVIWALWTMLVVVAYLVSRLLSLGDIRHDLDTVINDLIRGATPLDVMALMITFLGLWIGVWVAVRALHGRPLSSILSSERRMRWREFWIGMAIIAVYLALGLTLSALTGNAPRRSGLGLTDWLWIIGPMILLIFFQSSGEELLFRGYVIQNLSARFRSPIVWGFIPAVLFGLGHLGQNGSVAFNAYYFVSTALFGVIAAAVVWRTGGISTTIGMHVGNNIAAFLIAGPDDQMASTQLFLWPSEDMVSSAPFDLLSLSLMLAYVLSPLAPFPRKPLLSRRNETRAAP
jgi:membrane protease YdiL (CAAX protease family)